MKYSTYLKFSRKIRQIIWNLIFSSGFSSYGKNVFIDSPDIIMGEKYITIGDNVCISSQCWLMAINNNQPPELVIGKGTQIGRFSHLIAIGSINIGEKVLIADKVYISDNFHEFKNTNMAILDQPVSLKKNVSIGDGAWIGENVSIIGANIGKGAVVAANAVVTKDVPEYSVVAGVPAKIIRYL